MKYLKLFEEYGLETKNVQLSIPNIVNVGKNLVVGLPVKYRRMGLTRRGKIDKIKNWGEVVLDNGNTVSIFDLSIDKDKHIPNIKMSKDLIKFLDFILLFDLKVDYINIGKSNDTVSYLPQNRLKLVEEKGLDPWNNNYRQETRIGRFVRGIVGDKMNNYEIENFVNKFKAYFDVYNNKNELKLIKGEDIRHFYYKKNYNDTKKGTLWNSCMIGKKNQKKFDIYVKNPKVCSMLIRTDDDNKLVARAIVWKTNKGTFMDRVYYINDHDRNVFMDYAKKKGWNSYDADYYDEKMKVKLDWYEFKKEKHYPYMDTFQYLDRKKGTLSVDNTKDRELELDYT